MARRLARRGRVSDFDEGRGTGMVRADAGGEWPFHCTQLSDGSRVIAPGTAVTFEVGPAGPGRWEAQAVTRLP